MRATLRRGASQSTGTITSAPRADRGDHWRAFDQCLEVGFGVDVEQWSVVSEPGAAATAMPSTRSRSRKARPVGSCRVTETRDNDGDTPRFRTKALRDIARRTPAIVRGLEHFVKQQREFGQHRFLSPGN